MGMAAPVIWRAIALPIPEVAPVTKTMGAASAMAPSYPKCRIFARFDLVFFPKTLGPNPPGNGHV
jgi:hypothetical protein